MMLILSFNGMLLFPLLSFKFPPGHSSKFMLLVKFCSCVERPRIWKKLHMDKSVHHFCPKVIIFQSTFILMVFRITI